MSVKRGSLYGKGSSVLMEALRKRESVVTSGAFKATSYGDHKPYYHSGGELSDAEKAMWKIDRSSVTYVVWSYDTPIAWITRSADGTEHVHKVSQRFSVTTSRHQGKLYAL